MLTLPPRARAWAAVVLLGSVAAVAFALLAVPSPVLFGSLLAGMAWALAAPAGDGASLDLPPPLFRVGQALIGVTIGALVTLPTLTRLSAQWPSVLGVTLGTILLSALAGLLLARRHDVDAVTGVFALIAGGASGVVATSRDLGADERVVTDVQYLRVVIVLLAMPVVTTLVFHPPSGGAAAIGPPTRPLADIGFVALSVVTGLLLTRVVPGPAMSLLAPMTVAVAVSASGVLGEVAVPALLADVGYALIGARVGLRFTRASLRSIARMLPAATALVFLLILACAGLGLTLSAVTGVDRLTGYLATTPGGLFAVLATAADSGSDVTYVLAVQVIRVFAMLLVASLLGRAFSRGRTRCPPGRP